MKTFIVSLIFTALCSVTMAQETSDKKSTVGNDRNTYIRTVDEVKGTRLVHYEKNDRYTKYFLFNKKSDCEYDGAL
jgi:hypothetical protein